MVVTNDNWMEGMDYYDMLYEVCGKDMERFTRAVLICDKMLDSIEEKWNEILQEKEKHKSIPE